MDIFTEPKAINEFAEYRMWLHVWADDGAWMSPSLESVYPWPFAAREIDAEKLAAFMNITKMYNWPGQWPMFHSHWSHMATKGGTRKLFWKLAPGIGKHQVRNDKYPAYQIPEVFLNAIT